MWTIQCIFIIFTHFLNKRPYYNTRDYNFIDNFICSYMHIFVFVCCFFFIILFRSCQIIKVVVLNNKIHWAEDNHWAIYHICLHNAFHFKMHQKCCSCIFLCLWFIGLSVNCFGSVHTMWHGIYFVSVGQKYVLVTFIHYIPTIIGSFWYNSLIWRTEALKYSKTLQKFLMLSFKTHKNKVECKLLIKNLFIQNY